MRLNRIINEVIMDKVGVTSIKDKIREVRLKWFGYIKIRKSVDVSMRRCERIVLLKCKRCRGRPEKSENEVITHDLRILELMKDVTQDKRLWRSRINVSDCR